MCIVCATRSCTLIHGALFSESLKKGQEEFKQRRGILPILLESSSLAPAPSTSVNFVVVLG